MELVKLWESNLNKAYELYNKFSENENGFENPAYGMSFEEFEAYCLLKKDNDQGLNLKEGFVSDTVYLLVDEDKYVGIFNFRHELNDFLKEGPGHIGYGISPDNRLRNYAKKGLKLLLETVDIKEEEFYLSCNKDNPASLLVQLDNGAKIHHEDELHYYTRIKKNK